ncbi:MAG: hypothetical protein JWP29_1645 [Rhodoferax sp.]|nr:hypothetical protein [Rhodoferax sp.]
MNHCAVLLATWLLLISAAPARGETLQIGRAANSALADIAETVVDEAGRRAGVQFVYQKMPLPRSISIANEGELDGDLMRIRSVAVQYPQLMLVPTSIIAADLGVYGTAGTLQQSSRADIETMTIGIPRGVPVLRKYTQGLQVVEAQNYASLFEMLRAHRFDVVVMTQVDADAVLKAQAFDGLMRWPYAWATEPLYFLLNRKHAEIAARLDRALATMAREGLIRKYYLDGLRKNNIDPLPAR